MDDIDSIAKHVRELRGTDTVLHMVTRSEAVFSLPTILDNFVAQLGFERIGDSWREVTREDAFLILTRALERDLAYGVRFMEPSVATKLADTFVRHFATDSRFFTNGTYETNSPDFMPITDYTFDTGVIVVDAVRIGILWVRDED